MIHWWTEPTDLVTISHHFNKKYTRLRTLPILLFLGISLSYGFGHMDHTMVPFIICLELTCNRIPRVRWLTTTKSSHLPYTEGPPISIASSILQISLVILIRLNTTAVRTYQVPYLVAYWLPESIFAGRVTRIQYYEAKVIPNQGESSLREIFSLEIQSSRFFIK